MITGDSIQDVLEKLLSDMSPAVSSSKPARNYCEVCDSLDAVVVVSYCRGYAFREVLCPECYNTGLSITTAFVSDNGEFC